ncbi:hypothetical protein B0J17DRAFT_583063 [Rhizoctonia solani]|nr:hypothetical protein B0J17DRAFT_583063 [Rhizoctonia solani]
MLRRNSLSDLKIPARISRAQSGLKSNLGMVREFASCIEREFPRVVIWRCLMIWQRFEGCSPCTGTSSPISSTRLKTMSPFRPCYFLLLPGRLPRVPRSSVSPRAILDA